jgi:hypothetical protein
MEAASTFEKSVKFCQTTRHNVRENSHFHTNRRDNPKYQLYLLTLVKQLTRSGFDRRQGQRIFPLTSWSRPASEPTQSPIQWVPGALFLWVKRGRGLMLTAHPLVVPRLRKCRNYTSCHTNALLWSVAGPLYLLQQIKMFSCPCHIILQHSQVALNRNCHTPRQKRSLVKCDSPLTGPPVFTHFANCLAITYNVAALQRLLKKFHVFLCFLCTHCSKWTYLIEMVTLRL